MKTVVEATAGPSAGQASAATCVFEGGSPGAVASSSTVGVYVPTLQGSRTVAKARQKPGVRQFKFAMPVTNQCYWVLREITSQQEGRPVIVSLGEISAVPQFQFPSPGVLYTLWTALSSYRVEPSESIEKTSRSTVTGGVATVNESVFPEERLHPRWTELALSAFPGMREMTEAESAAYKAFKQKVFRRR